MYSRPRPAIPRTSTSTVFLFSTACGLRSRSRDVCERGWSYAFIAGGSRSSSAICSQAMNMQGSLRSLAVLWFMACAHPALPSDAAASTGAEPVIDRFSAAAGTLQVRTTANGLPGPGRPVDFDHPPFITQSWGPAGEVIRYYNFDVQPTTPARMY